MVHELTIEADLKLALLELEVEELDETVDIVEIGDIVDALPLKELNPLSELL